MSKDKWSDEHCNHKEIFQVIKKRTVALFVLLDTPPCTFANCAAQGNKVVISLVWANALTYNSQHLSKSPYLFPTSALIMVLTSSQARKLSDSYHHSVLSPLRIAAKQKWSLPFGLRTSKHTKMDRHSQGINVGESNIC